MTHKAGFCRLGFWEWWTNSATMLIKMIKAMAHQALPLVQWWTTAQWHDKNKSRRRRTKIYIPLSRLQYIHTQPFTWSSVLMKIRPPQSSEHHCHHGELSHELWNEWSSVWGLGCFWPSIITFLSGPANQPNLLLAATETLPLRTYIGGSSHFENKLGSKVGACWSTCTGAWC